MQRDDSAPATAPAPAAPRVRAEAPVPVRARLEDDAAHREERDPFRDDEGAARPVLRVASDETLDDIRRDMGECTRCKLHTSRTRLVFGVGNPRARLMFVGEGPGRDEDLQGEPFVGPAGQLLTKIIEAIGLAREDVYIANAVKSRPPNNRNPEPDEIEACLPFLERQIAAIRPAILVGLGNVPVKTLLNTTRGITGLRGKWQEYRGIPFMPTFHPSYLLRQTQEGDLTAKRQVWEDMQLVAQRYNEGLPSGMKPAKPKTTKSGS